MNLFALNKQEREKFRRNRETIVSRMPSGLDSKTRMFLIEELEMGLCRDIQAQRLPPNTKVPSRKNPFSYLKVMYDHTGNLKTSLASLLSPGSWTSSGGSFKLAEESGYNIIDLMRKKKFDIGKGVLLEVGAGYAGFFSQPPQGIHKLCEEFKDQMGKTVFAHFTNLTEWHGKLPAGVREYPGYAARDVAYLMRDPGLTNVDLIYSQCAAYFEPLIGQFVESSGRLLNANGKLVFNAPQSKEEEISEAARKSHLALLDRKILSGESNGNLYVLRKVNTAMREKI